MKTVFYFLLFNQYERAEETMTATTATPTTMYMSQSITSAKRKLPASAISHVSFLIFHFVRSNSVDEHNSPLLHLRGQVFNLREDIVVEEL